MLAQIPPGVLCVPTTVVNGDSCQSLFARSLAAPPPGQAKSLEQLVAWNPWLNCANLALGMQICLTEPIYPGPEKVPVTDPALTLLPTPAAGAVAQPGGAAAVNPLPTTIPPVLPATPFTPTPLPATVPPINPANPTPTPLPGAIPANLPAATLVPTPLPTTIPPVLPANSIPTPVPTPVLTPPPTPIRTPSPTPAVARAAAVGGPSPVCGTDFCCKMNILGTGVVGGIASATFACVPSVQNPNPAALLLVYLGDALMARAPTFTGVPPWVAQRSVQK